MNTPRHVLSTLFVVACAAQSIQAIELPEKEIAAFLQEQHMPRWEARPGARLSRDYEAEWLRWFERTAVVPFTARLRTNEEVKNRALRVVRQGIMLLRRSEPRDHAFSPGVMVKECEALVKADIKDPLLYVLQCWALYESSQNFQDCETAYKRARQHVEFNKMPASVRLWALSMYASVCVKATKSGAGTMPKPSDITKAALESLGPGSYLPEEDEVLVENMWPPFYETNLKENTALGLEICQSPTLSGWAGHMLTGRYHERMAWLERGHKFASEVKPEGWVGFAEHYQRAAESYLAAWKLRPQSPVAVRELLGISMTGADTGEKPIVWLNRVMETQFDDLTAFLYFRNGLLPRWGGSHDQMLAFGLSCAATKRFDTEVPFYFFTVLEAVVRDGGDWRAVCRRPLISKVALALCKQRVIDAASQEEKADALALLGCYSWLCGDYQAAKEALAQSPQRFSRVVVARMLPYTSSGWNEQLIRAESAIFAAGNEEAWRRAEKAWEEKDLYTALEGYELVRGQLDLVGGPGAALVNSRLAAVRFERQLAQGDWVRLAVDSSLDGWQVQKGDWTGDAEGKLTVRGRGTSAFIHHLARVGTEFQIRGEVKSGKSGFGVLIGHGFDSNSKEHWLSCMCKRGRAYILDRYYACTIDKRDTPKSTKDTTAFLITAHQGKITIEIDGVETHSQVVPGEFHSPQTPLPLMQDGHIGFCNSQFDNNDVTTILRSEVRLLPADFKAGQ